MLKVRKRVLSVSVTSLLKVATNYFDSINCKLVNHNASFSPFLNHYFADLGLTDVKMKKPLQKNGLFPLILVRSQSLRFLMLNFSKKIIYAL